MRMLTGAWALIGLWLLSGTAGAQEKFSLSMFHFNVQYVAGGLQGYPSGVNDSETFDLDDAECQDLIIVESFEPILDLFLQHPDWKVTLEMQAYMMEIMLERHPGIVAKLKTLYDAGQVELVSFHWSDQLFLAYPRRDMEVSHALMDPIWEQAGMTPSPVVFCQEGQFGLGMLPFGAERGRTIFVLPKNLFRYQHLADYDAAAPLYSHGGVDVIIGSRGFSTPDVEVGWNFFDDGELLATGGFAPYIGKDFQADPAAVAEYEAELEALVADGWRIATISEYVAWAKENNLEQRELPPMLDGTWQPPSTDSMHRWMGASGLIDQAYAGERDNQVLTSNVRARHRIAAAEALIAHAQSQGWIPAGELDDEVLDCWRHVLLGQVSDASGINPFVGEVRYGLEHAAAGEACADALLEALAPEAGGPFVGIDPATGEVVTADDRPNDTATPSEPVFTAADGFVAEAEGRAVEVRWEEIGTEEGATGADIHRVTVTIGLPDEPGDPNQRVARVAFPMALGGFTLTHGLTEGETVFYPFSDFDLMDGRITLPVANGLIGLDDDRWLIKQTDIVHLGAIFREGSGRVEFVDQTLDPAAGAEWVFWLVDGEVEDALALAGRLNLHPPVWVETGITKKRGCGCGTTPGGGLVGLLVLIGVSWGVSRRRWACRR